MSRDLPTAPPPAVLETAEIAERFQGELQAFIDQSFATTVTVHCTPTGYTIHLAQDGRVAPLILLSLNSLQTIDDVQALRRKVLAAALQLVTSGRIVDRWG